MYVGQISRLTSNQKVIYSVCVHVYDNNLIKYIITSESSHAQLYRPLVHAVMGTSRTEDPPIALSKCIPAYICLNVSGGEVGRKTEWPVGGDV